MTSEKKKTKERFQTDEIEDIRVLFNVNLIFYGKAIFLLSRQR